MEDTFESETFCSITKLQYITILQYVLLRVHFASAPFFVIYRLKLKTNVERIPAKGIVEVLSCGPTRMLEK